MKVRHSDNYDLVKTAVGDRPFRAGDITHVVQHCKLETIRGFLVKWHRQGRLRKLGRGLYACRK